MFVGAEVSPNLSLPSPPQGAERKPSLAPTLGGITLLAGAAVGLVIGLLGRGVALPARIVRVADGQVAVAFRQDDVTLRALDTFLASLSAVAKAA